MALDIYVGPASRYQAGNWKNVIELIAEARGIAYHKVGPKTGLLGGLFKPKPDDLYRRWRQQITTALTSAGLPDADWNDSIGQDYATDRPGWEGHAAFAAAYAYARNTELSPPPKAVSMQELAEDPAFLKELEQDASPVLAFISTQFFFPGNHGFAFQGTNFMGQPAGFCSLDLLDRALNSICQAYSLDRDALATSAVDQVGEEATFEQATRYAVSIYGRLTNEALARNLPLIVDG